MPKKEIIFVRGGKINGNVPWKFFHFHPTKMIDMNGLQLTYFDYPESKLKVWDSFNSSSFRYKNKFKLPVPSRESNLSPLINPRQSDGTVDASESIPTVLSLYNYIKSRPDNSIKSLQIFSHGDYDGPIIWNYVYELDKDLASARDIHDTEFRKKDFFGSNPLASSEGNKFRKKFTKDAYVKIYGCNEDYKYRKKIISFFESKKTSEKILIKKLYLDEIKETYAFYLSKTLGLEVWGAPLGWGTTQYPDKGEKYMGVYPPKKGHNWWIVSKHFRNYKKNKYLSFYKIVLKAPIDSGRFIGYSTKWLK